jgi:hypothetical protein
VHAKVSVIWNFVAPEGTGDTHYSMMRGTRCNLVIRQGKEEGYTPRLYIELTGQGSSEEFGQALEKAMSDLNKKYPGISVKDWEEQTWVVEIPDSFKVGHEAHFGQVTEQFLDYVKSGSLPDWEIPNMIVKYYTTTEGMKKAMEEQ